MNEKIFEALDAQFIKNRILFWYDEEGKQIVFAANQAAITIQGLEIDQVFEQVINKYLEFFTNRKERLDPLKTKIFTWPCWELSLPIRRRSRSIASLSRICA